MESADNGGMEINNVTPGSINKTHTPQCDDELKPFVGRYFKDFDDGVEFYKIYAEACGFDIRRGTYKEHRDGTPLRHYVYCNRQGKKNVKPDDSVFSSPKQKRRRVSNRVECMARIVLKFDPINGCFVDIFVEEHTHRLVEEEFKKYLKVNRNLGYVEKNFIMSCARVNVGPTKAHRFYKEIVGDFSSIGSTGNDWRNFSRDLRAYIDGEDAQVVLRKMALKKDSCASYYYDYCVDANDHLTCLFWADPVARRNYSIFGDVVSFDCTYRTNRYEMIFAPFTGKDNHGKIITFGASLLSGEDNHMYAWVFEQFTKCMGRSPRIIITDQDPAIKIVVDRVLPDSIHRLCMWHIMMKLPEKTPPHLKKDESFRQRINATVWSNSNETVEFEQQWNDIMEEFDLVDEGWFAGLYHIRSFWIPAYFRDIPMSGICRTTSISESVNNFFGHYLSQGSNLVEFLMHFESAMDAQRQAIDVLNNVDNSSPPLLKTQLKMEKHAASIYTTKIFIKVQEEIEASLFSCNIVSIKQGAECATYEIDDGYKDIIYVTCNTSSDDVLCSCNKFLRDGLLCRHIFRVFKHLKWQVIPEKYISSRWTKAAYSRPLHDICDVTMDCCVKIDDKKRMINMLTSQFYACIGAIEGDKDQMQLLFNCLVDFGNKATSENKTDMLGRKNSSLFDDFYGLPKTVDVSVLPPLHVKTKGSASRLIDKKQAAIERAKKPTRKCGNCGEHGHHDARNCPN